MEIPIPVLLLSLLAFHSASGEQQWTGVAYAGGYPDVPRLKTDTTDVLTITPQNIRLALKDGRKIELDMKQVGGFRYGNEAHGSALASLFVGLAGGISLGTAAATNALLKFKSHFVAIDFQLPAGDASSLLLRLERGSVSPILTALAKATGRQPSPENCVLCGPANESDAVEVDKKASPPEQPSPGKALIFVIRVHGGEGNRQIKLAVDGQWVGANNRKGRYFWFEAQPGLLRLCSQAANRAMFHIYVRANRTYYLEQKATIQDRASFFNAGTDVVELSKEQAKAHLTHDRMTRMRKQ
jgi:hypothetical protein